MENEHFKKKTKQLCLRESKIGLRFPIRAKKLKKHQNQLFIDVHVNGSFADGVVTWGV